MWEMLLRDLRSHLLKERHNAWNRLLALCAQRRLLLTAAHLQTLCEIRMEEDDDGVWRRAVDVVDLLRCLLPDAGLPDGAAPPINVAPPLEPAQQPDGQPALIDWVWRPFKRRSAVIGVADPNSRCDEAALIALARHLSQREFPEAEVLQFRSHDPAYAEFLFTRRSESVCLVGRLGLFGEEAIGRWGNKNARFGFLTHVRPPELKPGDVDHTYHCIYEQFADGKREHYRTRQGKGRRTDFGIVQRYPVFDGTRQVIVMICAGGSALGTLAAALWAAKHLALPIRADGSLLPAPPHLAPESRLEALVEVTAPTDSCVWEPRRLLLRKLYVDNLHWLPHDCRWQVDSPQLITLAYNGGFSGEPVAVLFDGARSRLRPKSEMFRLLAAVCLAARHNNGAGVDPAALCDDASIWRGQRPESAEIRRKLAVLKCRYLHDAIAIDDRVRILARIELQDDLSPAGGEDAT